MNQGKYIFSQVFSLISHKVFTTIVNRYNGDHKTKQFNCWKQFLCMAFGQLTQRDSLSDAILCLTANSNKLYHLGIGEIISKTTLTRANENRDWRIYADFCMILIEEARGLYINDSELDFDLANNVFAIDATTIDMCLSAFFWAKFRSTKGGIKIHTQLDLKTSIPSFIHITPANVHELNILDMIKFQPDSFYVLDRGYIDFDRFYHIHTVGAYFITRARKDFSFTLIKSMKKTERNIICDQIIKPRRKNFYAARDYPEVFRRIKYYDSENSRYFTFITNNKELKASQIATLYRHRWKIELFFKWIKQHLKIQSFWGRSENAVKTQIWIAISVYALVAIAKKRFGLKQSLYEILQVLSISVFEKISINELFEKKVQQDFKELKNNQLNISVSLFAQPFSVDDSLCICGSGTMGSGIAQAAAEHGIPVILYDLNPEMLSKASLHIENDLQNQVATNRIRDTEKKEILQRIHFTGSISECKAGIILEAIAEKEEAKAALFAGLEKINTATTLFASNTSSLSIKKISEQTSFPERIIGMHFFNPATRMKLVEIIKTDHTLEADIQRIRQMAARMGKTAVICKDAPGFIVNHVARPFYLEALRLAEMEIADMKTIDQLVESAGFKMGPFHLMDLIGNDINYTVSCSLYDALGEPGRLKPSILQELKVKQGELGRKTGKGWFAY